MFSPNCTDIYKYDSGMFAYKSYVKCFQNMTKNDIKTNNYKPRLTVYRRGGRVELKIEFSAPKLIFGNNFEELVDRDLDRVIEILLSKLKEMGITTNTQCLRESKVSTVHFGKNIVLGSGVSSSMILSELSQCDLYSRLDVSQSDYRNEGHILKWHANSYELAFYDKVKDLQQAQVSEKRALESDNYVQLNILDRIEDLNRKSVLRMELRLNVPVKIKSALKSIGENPYRLSFEQVFSSRLARKVLLDYWSKLTPQLQIVQITSANLSEAFVLLKLWNPTFKVEKLLKLFSGLILVKDGGMRSLRGKLGYCREQSAKWYRYLADLKSLKLPQANSYRSTFVIGQQIDAFIALKMSDLSLKST